MAEKGITLSELVKETGARRNTIVVRLHRLGIKPLSYEAIYPKSALDAIRNVPGKGRPKKITPESSARETISIVSEATPHYFTSDEEVDNERASVSFYDDIAAGPPIWQSDDPGWAVDVPLRYIRTKPEDYYAMRVCGGSMTGSNIRDGDMVLIRRSNFPRHDTIQAVWLDGQVTLKYMMENEGNGWTLHHDDGTGRTIPLGEENHVQGDFMLVLPLSTLPYQRGD